MVLQAWFDESGKTEDPVFVLVGYIGKKTMWEGFADDWQAELDREPRLPYLHAKERQLFKGFSDEERTERLLRFVAIIRKHQPRGVAFLLKHSDYRKFYRIVSVHPTITNSERRMMKNPYYVCFQWIFIQMLLRQARKLADSGITEPIEILFDDGLEQRERLRLGFEHFITTAKQKHPEALQLLINRGPEFRDDEQMSPLQACDLSAWHFRRFCWEASIGNGKTYRDPVWTALRESIEYDTYPFKEKDWVKLLLRLRESTWNELARQQA